MKFENVLCNTHNIYIFIYLFVYYYFYLFIIDIYYLYKIFTRAIVFYIHLTVFNILERKKQEIAFP